MINTPVTQELEQISKDYNKLRLLKRLTAFWACVAGLYPLSLIFTGLTGAAIPNLPKSMGYLAVFGALFLVIAAKKKRATIMDVAREIEKRDPKLNTLLLAAVEQQPDSTTGKFHFLQERAIREATRSVRGSAWGQKYTESLFFAQCVHLFAVALLLVCAALSSVSRSTEASIAANAQRKEGVKITPGNVEVEKGTGMAILAEFGGSLPQKVELQIQPRTGSARTVALVKNLNDPVFGGTLSEVTNDFSYKVIYDGKTSEEFKVSVFEYPELKQADATIDYPEYTALADKTIEDTRRVSALEGSKVEFLFQLNKPVKVAQLVGENEKITLIKTTDRPNVFQLSMTMEETKKFSLHLVDEAGRTNRFPPEVVFQALKNETPKFKFVTPRGDQKVSPLQEVPFHGEVEDDFGLMNYGLTYTLSGSPGKVIAADAKSKGREKMSIQHLLSLEDLKAEADQLVSFYLWAEDYGPDGLVRRTASDMFFAEVRPFEEIFREGGGDSSSQQQQQQQGGAQTPSQKLAELQKQIITATWNLQRGAQKIRDKYKTDLEVVLDSQKSAFLQAGEMKDKVQEEKMKAVADAVLKDMGRASEELDNAKSKLASLNTAVEAEQSAYQGLLKLQAREHQVSRSRQRGGGGGGGGAGQQQLDQLELKSEENRYETESQAQAQQNPAQREELQVLNRLKELARRQEDMSERLKELQLALNEAKTEEEKDSVRRQLKRLQEEQQQIVQNMDELKQRMAEPENQSRMANARDQLDQTRQQASQSSQQLNQGEVSQALASSTRTQEDLKKLSEDFRKSTSQQFAEDMRNMRQQARQLQENQQKIAQDLASSKESKQKRLTDTGERKQAQEALEKQKEDYKKLVQNMKRVTEQAETSEPILSRQLYETIRKTGQQNLEQTLETSARFLERNFVVQASELEQKARKTIDELKTGVDRAAANVLGDETEALRLAQKELDELARRVERELAASGMGASSTNQNLTNLVAGIGPNGERAIPGQESRTNRLASASGRNGEQGNDANPGERNQSGERGQRQSGEQQNDGQNPGQQNGQGQQAQAGEQGQPGQTGQGGQGQGQGQGQRNQQIAQNNQQGGGQGQGQNQNQPQQQGEGRGEGNSVAQNQNQQGGGGRGERNQPGQEQPRDGRRAGARNFFDRPAGNEGGGDGGGGGGYDGPITGTQYGQWTDRLRDVEEMIDDPDLRNQVARIREDARTMRRQFGTDKKPPQWDLVQTKIVTPMRSLQSRLSEELARRQGSESLVPVDRDPVPAKFSELVNKYYEELGRGN